MTAYKGVLPFQSEESKFYEDECRQTFNAEVNKRKQFEIKKKLSLKSIHGSFIQNSCKGNGDDSYSEPDLGYLFLKGKLVGIGEIKYQVAKTNGCQRVFVFLSDLIANNLNPNRYLTAFFGPGFNQNVRGGSTWPTIERLRSIGSIALSNPTKEEFAIIVNEYLDRIEKEEKHERD